MYIDSTKLTNLTFDYKVVDELFGKKNWMFHDSVKGAQASAVIYSISGTA